jgi:hypothetical protein
LNARGRRTTEAAFGAGFLTMSRIEELGTGNWQGRRYTRCCRARVGLRLHRSLSSDCGFSQPNCSLGRLLAIDYLVPKPELSSSSPFPGIAHHVTDYRLVSGEVELAVISDVEMQLPRTEAFGTADLNPMNINQAIRAAEGAPSAK